MIYLVATKNQRGVANFAIIFGELPKNGEGKQRETYVFTQLLDKKEERYSLDQLILKYKEKVENEIS
jgi:hypothetical protein